MLACKISVRVILNTFAKSERLQPAPYCMGARMLLSVQPYLVTENGLL